MTAVKAAENHGDEGGLTWYFWWGILCISTQNYYTHSQNSQTSTHSQNSQTWTHSQNWETAAEVFIYTISP